MRELRPNDGTNLGVAMDVALRQSAPSQTASVDRWVWVRRGLLFAYFVRTVLYLGVTGRIPSDRELIVGWLLIFAVVATTGKETKAAGITLLSWAPFLLALFLYDFARAIGHWINSPLHITPQIAVDRFLGGGRLWTERLQGWLIDKKVGLGVRSMKDVEQTLKQDKSTMHWYDVMAAFVYQTHFLFPYLTAGVLWAKGQRIWRWYAATFVFVNFVASAIFAIRATAPPWYAAQLGLIKPFPRVLATRGWSQIGLKYAARVIEKGQKTVNPFAAIPSLHSAQALLIAIFLWRVWPYLRPLLVALPIAMTFTLVYSGEHYLIDVFAGWGLVAVGLVGGAWLRKRKGWKSPWTDGPAFEQQQAPERPSTHDRKSAGRAWLLSLGVAALVAGSGAFGWSVFAPSQRDGDLRRFGAYAIVFAAIYVGLGLLSRRSSAPSLFLIAAAVSLVITLITLIYIERGGVPGIMSFGIFAVATAQFLGAYLASRSDTKSREPLPAIS